VLAESHSAAATYLFQQDKFYDTSLDTGDKHVQCGRRADVLKFWLMWKAKVTLSTYFSYYKTIDLAISKRSFFILFVNTRIL
jgi:hypothetical protein